MSRDGIMPSVLCLIVRRLPRVFKNLGRGVF